MQIKFDIYLSSQPPALLAPGGELLFAGQYCVDLPPAIAEADHQTRMRNLERDDAALADRIVETFRNSPPSDYAGRALGAGDVLTFFEGGFMRGYMLLPRSGVVRLRNAVYGANELKLAALSRIEVNFLPLVKITTVYGDYKVTIALTHGRLSPMAGDFTFPAS